MWAKVRAQNWLQSYDGRSFVNNFMYPPNNIGGTLRKVLDETITGSAANYANVVYPNPVSDFVNVSYTASNDKTQDIQFVLTDLLGRTMLQKTLANKGSQQIAIDQLAAGVYFYTIREQNTITLSGKLIKK